MAKVKKKRADLLLIEQGLVADKEEAKRLILLGLVRSRPDHIVRKTTETYPINSIISVDRPSPYVSRGAFKLKKAMMKFSADLTGKTCLDVGASTGGFTDLMLSLNAQKVYTVDSGTNQLHYKLRSDERVICRENFNARHLSHNEVPEKIDITTMDVSFISSKKILPSIAPLCKPGSLAYILVKPQFEVSKDQVGDGVIRDKALRLSTLECVCNFADKQLNWKVLEKKDSPLAGPKGNLEFLVVFQTP